MRRVGCELGVCSERKFALRLLPRLCVFPVEVKPPRRHVFVLWWIVVTSPLVRFPFRLLAGDPVGISLLKACAAFASARRLVAAGAHSLLSWLLAAQQHLAAGSRPPAAASGRQGCP